MHVLLSGCVHMVLPVGVALHLILPVGVALHMVFPVGVALHLILPVGVASPSLSLQEAEKRLYRASMTSK